MVDKVSLGRSSVNETVVKKDRDQALAATPAKKVGDDGVIDSIPDYVVSITAEKIDEKSTYSPAEVKAKAKAFLAAGNLSGKEAAVLGEILDKEK